MLKAAKKYAVIVRVRCSTWWHIGHYSDRAIIVETSRIEDMEVVAENKTTGAERPIKTIAIIPVVAEKKDETVGGRY